MIIQSFVLEIGGLFISYEYSKPIEFDEEKPFCEFICKSHHSDIKNKIFLVDNLQNISNKTLLSSTKFWKLWHNKQGYIVEFFNDKNIITSVVHTSYDFSKNSIYILESIIRETIFLPSDVHAFLMVGYLNWHDTGLFLHGAMVEYLNKGIVFSGISGSGKSTISALFSQTTKSPIITDDRILVRFENGIQGFSTPYDWKIERCQNKNMPLKCILYVKHGRSNAIRTLSYDEKIKYLLTTNLIPFYVPNGISKTLNAFNNIINNIPIYEYSFIPEKSAIKHLLENIL